jgi:hypothetical protein
MKNTEYNLFLEEAISIKEAYDLLEAWGYLLEVDLIDKFQYAEKIKELYPRNERVVEMKHEPIHATLNRFIQAGVFKSKMIPTENPSVVIWSKTRKCLVGGKGQPDTLELIQRINGVYELTYENNIFISLQVRSELTESDVKEINESEGIIVTNATYGEPYFRYGFIPQ